MKTDSSKMDTDTAELSSTEWLEKFHIISQEEFELLEESSSDHRILYNDDDDDDDSDDDDDDYVDVDDDGDGDDDENRRRLKAQYDRRMARMSPLFASQPRLEKICKDPGNDFFDTCFTSYIFNKKKNDSLSEFHEEENDLKYLLNLCGSTLTSLYLMQYPTSQMMPIINANCPNLESLLLRFEEIKSQDFENVFSNMSHLRHLTIGWECKNLTPPMTLAKSLEQIGGTLDSLYLSFSLEGNNMFSPDLLPSVFPPLIALKTLTLSHFGLSQQIIQSISEMKNLTDLSLQSPWLENCSMLDTRFNMYPIGNLTTLEKLWINFDHGVRDEFLINLSKNAKKLRILCIVGKYLTDLGMSAINNLKQLRKFDLGLAFQAENNEYITDESIQCLIHRKLKSLNISNCIKITDKSVLQLVKNLPSLKTLHIRNTKITREAVEKLNKLSERREVRLRILHATM